MSVLFRERRDDAASLIAGHRRSTWTAAGVTVNDESAHRHSAVWACRAAIAEAVQQLPLEESTRSSGGMVRRDPPAMFDEPQVGVPWASWVWAQAWTLAGQGKAYAWVELGRGGEPVGLSLVDPSSVRWQFARRSKSWLTFVDNEPVDRWPRGALWHCPLYVTAARPDGMSPVEFHAESIGVGLAAQEFGARFFGDGGHPTMVGSTDHDPGAEGAKALKARLLDIMRGNRELLILPKSMKLDRWQVNPDESQFLETMRYSGEDVARIFGVPPSKIALAVSGSSVTYQNVADQNDAWRVGGLARYVTPLESALSTLLPGGRDRVLRFNFDGFLRANQAARFVNYKTATEIGSLSGTPLLTVNEMRRLERLAPLAGGDEFKPAVKPDPVQVRSAQLSLPLIEVPDENSAS